MLENIPNDLWVLVWAFAWNHRPNKPPLEDLLGVLDIQQSIPAMFLRDRVPPREWVVSHKANVNQLYQLFPLNPFKKGNPYRPFGTVDPDFPIWSNLPSLVINMIQKAGVRELVTYRGVLERRLTRHYNRPLLGWNKSFQELFLPISRLDPKFYRNDLWKVPFTSRFLSELRGACFLSTALP